MLRKVQVRAISHYPVLWRNVNDLLAPLAARPAPLVADCTLGAGGHSAKILELLPNAYLLGVDVDKEVLPIAENNLKSFTGRYRLFHSSYVDLWKLERFPDILGKGQRFGGVVADLGMSSVQLDSPERGFAYSKPGPLDMRFNRQDPLAPSAKQIVTLIQVNFASELELRELFRVYGEEPLYRQAADVIIRYREKQPINTTKELSDVLNYAFFIAKSINRFQSIGRCFQALRIKVNNELTNLDAFLSNIFPHIEVDGVLIVISFHSLEDTRVKNQFEQWMGEGVVELKERMFLQAGAEELAENSRSGSARLRYCVKKADHPQYRRKR